jgi:single-stranded-DNA-specific exonuclease
MSKEWIIPPPHPERANAARRWQVPELIAQLLLNRGVEEPHSVQQFFEASMKELHTPDLLPGAVEAADRLVHAAQAGRRIVVYGDYDVDGTTGLSILWHMLKAAGAEVSYYVPHRVEEGFGLNTAAVQRLAEDGAHTIVSVDCGITGVEAAAHLAATETTLIITDHHTPPAELPDAAVIVHPIVGGAYPNPSICGAGVAFKLAWAIAQRLSDAARVRPELRALLMDLLPLAALGTIADVVPLWGENRIIARHGLAGLRESRNPGLRALIELAGLSGTHVEAEQVGFRLAPRINAAGRMGHARLAVELFTQASPERAHEIAQYLEEHNRKRQATERKITRNALARIEREGLADDTRRAIVLADEEWHPGVIGIVASRIVDRFHRPTIMIALNGKEGQGSGRSISRFDLHAGLEACAGRLISFGGHRMAAGLRVEKERVDEFAEAFVEVANQRLGGRDLLPKLKLDAEVELPELTLSAARAMTQLGPFGMGNPRPRFATDWLELATEPRTVGADGSHLQATFAQEGVQIRAIGFGMGSQLEDLKHMRRCRVAFEPIINNFNGRQTVEMQMLDLRFPDEAGNI